MIALDGISEILRQMLRDGQLDELDRAITILESFVQWGV